MTTSRRADNLHTGHHANASASALSTAAPHTRSWLASHPPVIETIMNGGTLVSDFTVRFGLQCGGLRAAVTAALASGEPVLGAAQLCHPALEVSGISLPNKRRAKLSSPTSMPISSDGNLTLSRSTEKHT